MSGNGFTLSNNQHIRYNFNDNEFSGTNLTILSGTYSTIDIEANLFDMKTGYVGLSITTGVTFSSTTGGGLIANNMFVGDVTGSTILSGITYYANDWEVQGNLNLQSSSSLGGMYLNGNLTVTPLTVNIWAKVSGTTSGGTLQQFSMLSSGRLIYNGKRTKEAQIVVPYSVSTVTGTETVQVSLYKNGVLLPTSVNENRLQVADEAITGCLVALTTISTNDYFELYMRNISSDSDGTIEYMNYTIKA
jgi:hypothetical protein